MLKINQEFPIQFSQDLYDAFSGLAERHLMTPSYLSRVLVMSSLLPAQFHIEKNKPLKNDEQGICTVESLFNRLNMEGVILEKFKRLYNKISATHTLISPLQPDGIELLEAIQKERGSNREYAIFYCGNGQDAMHPITIHARITENPKKNCIFWNYPGVGSSIGIARSKYDLFKAGYQQAKRLIDQGVPAKNITLHGFSLGGCITMRAARQLHEEGHLVNLEIDRSFAYTSLVVPENIKRIMIDGHTGKQSCYTALISSTIALAISGVALGTAFASFAASLGLVTASTIATIGYMGALCIQAFGFFLQKIMAVIGEIIAFSFSFFSDSISDSIKSLFNTIAYCLAYPFNLIAVGLNELFSATASFIDIAFNLTGSITGGAIAIGGLVSGSLAGLIFGVLLSIQLLWTEAALTIPMAPAFSALLFTSCCEIDSVIEMNRLLDADNKPENKIKERPKISVTNVIDDKVIVVAASLSTGLGLKPGKSSDDNRILKEKVTSFWYRKGGHTGDLVDLIDPCLPFNQ